MPLAAAQRSLVEGAAARGVAVVLSLPSTGMFRHCKSRFLHHDEAGYWLELDVDQRALADELIANGVLVAVSFKSGDRKVSFAGRALRRDSAFELNGGAIVEAILLSEPTEIRSVQRRSSYRVRLTPGCGITVRMWRLADRAVVTDPPQPSAEIFAEARDLSTGGMGIALTEPAGRKTDEPVRLYEDQRLRVEIRTEGEPIVIEGRLRYFRGTRQPGARAGVQFKKLESDLSGRQAAAKLNTLIGQMQRDEVRRMRLGMTG